MPKPAMKYDGAGGFAPNSHDIPLIDAALYVGGTSALIWAAVTVARWILGY
ncbi:MAG TPA: hypothetical protein VNS29_04050 [Burkholderiaceae bacterium]|nr:hypothetical protein [Burkholderiaceae bacterium]